MPKHSKHRSKGNKDVTVAKSHGEMLQALRALGAEYDKLRASFEQQRRINWILVNNNHGRIEVPADVYKACFQGPPEDYIIRIEPSPDQKTIAFVECDEKGEPVNKIIVPG